VEALKSTVHVQRALLAFYRKHARDLPWRRTCDPYAIWVSEIMLQQTRAAAVIPYYHRFLERFPSVEALAEAAEPEVLALWSGLGYYSRARNLLRAARQIAARGTFPRRNRLVSGLSDATVVVEAGRRSGALITAGWALEQGRDCFLVPGPFDSPMSAGCNAFLRSFPGQARIVAGIPELIEDLGLEIAEAAVSSTPPASTTFASPSRTACAPETIACRPLAHALLSVCAGVVSGRPARRPTCRARLGPLPAWRAWPKTSSSTAARSATPARAPRTTSACARPAPAAAPGQT